MLRMLRAQKMNGDMAAQNIPNASHGRNSSQHNALVTIAIDSDNRILP